MPQTKVNQPKKSLFKTIKLNELLTMAAKAKIANNFDLPPLMKKIKALVENPHEIPDLNNKHMTLRNAKFSPFATFKPLLLAADLGEPEVLRYFFDHGANLDAGDNQDLQVLNNCLFARSNDEAIAQCVQILVAKGAPVMARYKGHNALHIAAGLGNLPAVQVLGEKLSIAEINEKNDGGFSALHHAAAKGFANIAAYLLEKGALVAISPNEQNAFDMALQQGIRGQDIKNSRQLAPHQNPLSSLKTKLGISAEELEKAAHMDTLHHILNSGQVDPTVTFMPSSLESGSPLIAYSVFQYIEEIASQFMGSHQAIAKTQYYTILLKAGAGLNVQVIPPEVKSLFKIPADAEFCILVHDKKAPKQRKIITTLAELAQTLADQDYEFQFAPLLKACGSPTLSSLPSLAEISRLLLLYAPAAITEKVLKNLNPIPKTEASEASVDTPFPTLSKQDFQAIVSKAVTQSGFVSLNNINKALTLIKDHSQQLEKAFQLTFFNQIEKGEDPAVVDIVKIRVSSHLFHFSICEVITELFKWAVNSKYKYNQASRMFFDTAGSVFEKLVDAQALTIRYLKADLCQPNREILLTLSAMWSAFDGLKDSTWPQAFSQELHLYKLQNHLFLAEIALNDADIELSRYYGQKALTLLNSYPPAWLSPFSADKHRQITTLVWGSLAYLGSRLGWQDSQTNKWLEMAITQSEKMDQRHDYIFLALQIMFEQALEKGDCEKARDYLENMKRYAHTVDQRPLGLILRLSLQQIHQQVNDRHLQLLEKVRERNSTIKQTIENLLGELGWWDAEKARLILKHSPREIEKVKGLSLDQIEENTWKINDNILRDSRKLTALAREVSQCLTTPTFLQPAPHTTLTSQLSNLLIKAPADELIAENAPLTSAEALQILKGLQSSNRVIKKHKKKTKLEKIELEERIEANKAEKEQSGEPPLTFSIPPGYCTPIMIRSPNGGFPDNTHFLIMPTRAEYTPFFQVAQRAEDEKGQYVVNSVPEKGRNQHGVKFSKKLKHPTGKTISSIKIKNSDDDRAIGILFESYTNEKKQLMRLYKVDEITDHKKLKLR